MGWPLLRTFVLLPVVFALAGVAAVLILVWTAIEHLKKRRLCATK